jgi:hypothetical protein
MLLKNGDDLKMSILVYHKNANSNTDPHILEDNTMNTMMEDSNKGDDILSMSIYLRQ